MMMFCIPRTGISNHIRIAGFEVSFSIMTTKSVLILIRKSANTLLSVAVTTLNLEVPCEPWKQRGAGATKGRLAVVAEAE